MSSTRIKNLLRLAPWSILVLVLLSLLTSCEKEETAPAAPAPEKPLLYTYRVVGFKNNGKNTVDTMTNLYGTTTIIHGILSIDEAEIKKNGVLMSNRTYGYQVEFKKGDRLTFRFSGVRDSLQKECNFAIYRLYNGPYEITYFHAIGNVITGEYIIP